jgi:hypothetical protein
MCSSGHQFGPGSYANQSLLYHIWLSIEAACLFVSSLVYYVRLQRAPLFQTDYAISFVERIPARKTYLQHAVSSTALPDFFFVITKSPNIA